MESKGRRTPRVAGPVTAPGEPVDPLMRPPTTADPVEPSREPPEPAPPPTIAAMPAEITLDSVTAAADEASPPKELSGAPATKPETAHETSDFSRETLAAFAQSHAALSRGLEALSAEMASLAFSGIDSAARTATEMLSVKTLSDAVAVNAGFTCGSIERLVGSSAKLSELGLRLATEASQPILSQIGKGWTLASRNPS